MTLITRFRVSYLVMSMMVRMLGSTPTVTVIFNCRVSLSSSWLNVLGCKGQWSSESLSHGGPLNHVQFLPVVKHFGVKSGSPGVTKSAGFTDVGINLHVCADVMAFIL